MQEPVIQSLLDTDLYKYTMQQSMVNRYPDAKARMVFRSRSALPIKLSLSELQKEVDALADLRLTASELDWLASLPFISMPFIEYLRAFRLDPSAVELSMEDGQLAMAVSGNWSNITHFEIFLLAIVSELHCRNAYGNDRTLIEAQGQALLDKKLTYLAGLQDNPHYAGFQFVDFGTRRRYSRDWQAYVVRRLHQNIPQFFTGTSNLDLARRYGLQPVGTMAHEWLQSHQVLGHSLLSSQKDALNVWLDEYQGQLGIALTDTISMASFLRDFDHGLAAAYSGLRHDSGDPIVWGEQALAHYQTLGIDPREKTLIFSDKLDLAYAASIYQHFRGRVRVSFGIGTYLTNDMGWPAPSVVIKLVEVNGLPVAKLSDSPGKTMCQDDAFIGRLKDVFQYQVAL